MISSKEEDCQFNPKSSQAKNYTSGIYRLYAKLLAFEIKIMTG